MCGALKLAGDSHNHESEEVKQKTLDSSCCRDNNPESCFRYFLLTVETMYWLPSLLYLTFLLSYECCGQTYKWSTWTQIIDSGGLFLVNLIWYVPQDSKCLLSIGRAGPVPLSLLHKERWTEWQKTPLLQTSKIKREWEK